MHIYPKMALALTLPLTLALGSCQPAADRGATNVGPTDHAQSSSVRSNVPSSDKPAPNPTKNAYFGDTHVHTKNSFDAYIVGTRTNANDAYRFAKGEAIDNGGGHSIRLDGPPA